MPSQPPRSSARTPKRPWYLVAALIGAWVFGAGSWGDGCNAAAFYKGASVDVSAPAQALTDVQSREQVIALGSRYVEVMDAAKNRALPLGIASLLLGMAMVLLSVRSMMGQGGARRALVQVVAVHAALLVLAYFLTADVRVADLAFRKAIAVAQMREQRPDAGSVAQMESVAGALAKVIPPLQLAFRTLASALIVLALTRPRARAFFEPAAGSLSER
jgi:hypothetical protein